MHVPDLCPAARLWLSLSFCSSLLKSCLWGSVKTWHFYSSPFGAIYIDQGTLRLKIHPFSGSYTPLCSAQMPALELLDIETPNRSNLAVWLGQRHLKTLSDLEVSVSLSHGSSTNKTPLHPVKVQSDRAGNLTFVMQRPGVKETRWPRWWSRCQFYHKVMWWMVEPWNVQQCKSVILKSKQPVWSRRLKTNSSPRLLFHTFTSHPKFTEVLFICFVGVQNSSAVPLWEHIPLRANAMKTKGG